MRACVFRLRVLAVLIPLLLLPGAAGAGTQTQPAAPAPGQVPLFDNLGAWHHKITTTSPQAQRYFDQGLRLVYGFNHDEAQRAFEEAARLDPDCAMAYWGVAYTLGPNINLPTDPERAKKAYDAVQKALSLKPKAAEAERAWIDALAKRYAPDLNAPNADRAALDTAYAGAMRDVAKRYPDDADAATLFAEAMMDLRPWEFWTRDGTPQPGTAEIVATLEGVLKNHPDHPGANHYYIHAVEASPHPEKALPSADRFTAGLVPGAGHLVHMPAHIYMRTGRYGGAVEANARAVAVDEAYFNQANPQGVYPMMYYGHNLQFLCSAAGMDGRSAEAVKAAEDLVRSIPVDAVREMPMIEFILPLTIFSRARFGMWDSLLALPAPPADQRYTTAIWHWGRSLAQAAKGRFDEADKEKAAFDAAAAAVPPDIQFVLNASGAIVSLAKTVLEGELAARRGKTDEAVAKLEEAVKLEDALHYDEPPAWYAPVRHTLGAVLFDAKRYAEAEAVYLEDLKINPDNGWSLFGLVKCLEARHADTADAVKRFKAAWTKADVVLTASRF